MLKIKNTLSKEKEIFEPIEAGKVRLYYCGPTVYKTQHIGGLRGNTMADLIRRSLTYLDYEVNFVSNYTDVGHLTGDNEGDADLGEDRMEKSVKETGQSPQEIADLAIADYERDTQALHISPPTTRCRATNYISEIIEMVEILLKKGFAYQTELAIYFDISKAQDYNRLSGQKIEENISGAGSGDVSDSGKRNPADFSVWFFKAGAHKNALQTWDSPWGEGFPGWHIECSAMSKKHLGKTLDIHMGGIEHIPIHHTNEIAQSEAVNDAKFVNYWIHNEHLIVNNTKMSKSLGNVIMLQDIIEKGFDPLDLRYFFLQAHYRSKQNFTWEALEASQNARKKLLKKMASFPDGGEMNEILKNEFIKFLEDDFALPRALTVVFKTLKNKEISDADKKATILDFDKVLGIL